MSEFSEKPSEVSENRGSGGGRSAVNVAVADDLVRERLRAAIETAAGDADWRDTREAWLARAARRLGLTAGRCRRIWYGEARRIDAAEYVALTARAAELAERAAARRRRAADLRQAVEDEA